MEKINRIQTLFVSLVLAIILLVCGPLYAQSPAQTSISSFQMVKQILVPSDLVVPTVLEFPISPYDIQNLPVALYEVETASFVRLLLQTKSSSSPVRVMSNGADLPALHDNNRTTSADFPANDTGETTTVLTYETVEPVSSVQLDMPLDSYVRQPASVTIYVGENRQLAVSDKLLTGGTLYFPETTASKWEISIRHTQPLRILELNLVPSRASVTTSYSIRFLAQPHRSYRLYTKPNQGVIEPPVAYVDLENVTSGVRTVDALTASYNPAYISGDQDGDRVEDTADNCPLVANANQADIDKNNVGDACEDFDHDTVMNNVDNCPKNPNIDQNDADGDTYGDVCDPEESRLTERYWWLPWVGIVVGFGVVFFIFANSVKPEKQKDV